MKSPSRCPSYLVHTDFSYCFRMNVPADLRLMIGRQELRFSLKTGYRGKAKFKARILAGQVQRLFIWIRKGGARLKELSNEKIQELVQQYLKKYVEGLESRYYEPDELPVFWNREEADTDFRCLDFYKKDIQTYLRRGDCSTVENIIADLLKRNGIDGVEKGSAEYIKLCRAILRAQLKGIEFEKKHGQGEYPLELSSISTPVLLPKEEESEMLFKVIASYWNENERAGNWRPRTKVEYERALEVLKRFFGNVLVRTISPKRMNEYKEILGKLPANFGNDGKYKDQAISDLVKIEYEKRLSASSINKYLGVASGVFKYAVRHGSMERNPAEGMQISIKKKGKRDPFSKEDLEQLFHSEEYMNDTHLHPHQFWLPVMGLFMGARIEELCQLTIQDVKKVNEIWVVDVKEDEEAGKGVKTPSSNRCVPLHPFIVEDLRFVQYVESLREKGEKMVFPELKKIAFRFSHAPSKWFGNYKRKCGIVSRKKVFHSFRHNFTNWCKQNRLELSMYKQIVGHDDDDMTTGVYGENYPPETLYGEVISKIEYGIDLSHLKRSKYVVGHS